LEETDLAGYADGQVDALSIAKFSRIGLTEGELLSMGSKFSAILEAFNVVSKIPVSDFPEYQEAKNRKSLRCDEALDSLGQSLALSGAPASFDGHFRVPPVL
jgi:aspartyl-tRNA(Asn)/glutamyl-tRNA(Gln) amidotransferase subunit C